MAWLLKFPEPIAYLHIGRSFLSTAPSFTVLHTDSTVRTGEMKSHRDAPQNFHLIPPFGYLPMTPSLWKSKMEWNRVFWVLLHVLS